MNRTTITCTLHCNRCGEFDPIEVPMAEWQAWIAEDYKTRMNEEWSCGVFESLSSREVSQILSNLCGECIDFAKS